MRLAFWALPQARFPAVVHLDGTGRVQTVSASDNAWLYALLKERRECRTAAPHAARLYRLVACVCCLSPAVNRMFHVMVRGMLGPTTCPQWLR